MQTSIDRYLKLFESELFQSLEKHFAKQMIRLEGQENSELFLLSGLLSYEMSKSNTCLDLTEYAGKNVQELFPSYEDEFVFPSLESWLNALKDCHQIASDRQIRPIIYQQYEDKHLFFLQRYWAYENTLLEVLGLRLKNNEEENLTDESLLNTIFPVSQTSPPDLQRTAALMVLKNRFSVITGGPGTGKTTIIVKILALLQTEHTQRYPDLPYQYSLVAPTGKAASRLKQSIAKAKQELFNNQQISLETYNSLHDDTSTIHRCLGAKPNSIFFKHNKNNLLSIDCLIVDEASMVDLALMAKLISAVPNDARIIFLGDEHQLSSVEAGSVMGDICSSLYDHKLYQHSIVRLLKSYRFDSNKGIGKLSYLTNQSLGKEAFDYIQKESAELGDDAIVQWINAPSSNHLVLLLTKYLNNFRNIIESKTPLEAFKYFNAFIILCALKKGYFGAIHINTLIEDILTESKLIDKRKVLYHGLPLMITRNDYHLNLYNGDIGICLYDPESDDLKVFFEEENTHRKVSPHLLPQYETAFSMTVHKSQGSEFEQVLLLLPPEQSQVVTKELIYTGITRAKKKVTIVGRKDLFIKSANSSIQRFSGLKYKMKTL